MGKTGTKRKKAEKAKVQFKKSKTAPGQHLPKGTNVTKTEFKVGKIVIPKQCDVSRVGAGEPVTKKKLGLRELLAKVGHFSQAVRMESLEGVKELVVGKYGGNLVQENLALLVARLAPLTADRERKVRRTASEILQAILMQVPGGKLEPLFPVLMAHVSCSLTHIDPAIQQDGLILIDSLVNTVPAFVALNYARILPDCVEQISARRKDTDKTKGVTNEVSETVSVLKWRMDVLQRVDKILDALLTHNRSAEQQECLPRPDVVYQNNLHCPLYQEPAERLLLTDLGDKSVSDPMLEVVDTILPLILDSWVEATTVDTKKRRLGNLTTEVRTLLGCIAGILNKLVSYAQLGSPDSAVIARLQEKYFTDLNHRLFSHMPYSCGSVCSAENILLSNAFLVLADHLDPPTVGRILASLRSPDGDSCQRLQVLKNLLTNPHKLDTTTRKMALDLLQEMGSLLPPGSKARFTCIRLLSSLAEKDEELSEWLATLPSRLTRADMEEEEELLILETILKFSKMRNEHLLMALNTTKETLQVWSEELTGRKREPFHQLFSYIQHHCR